MIIMFYYRQLEINFNNQTPLHIAAKNNYREIGELLIRKGADLSARAIIYQIIIILFLINQI